MVSKIVSHGTKTTSLNGNVSDTKAVEDPPEGKISGRGRITSNDQFLGGSSTTTLYQDRNVSREGSPETVLEARRISW